ncbi:MAG TPA: ubiquinol-cytochrome c reductase iron-sulfur subunit [bacterium]
MSSELRIRYRITFLVALGLFLSNPFAFAEIDFSSTLSLSSAVITAGFIGLGLLVAFVAIQTAVFLVKALKESAQAKKEAALHSSSESKKDAHTCLADLVFRAAVVFTFIALVAILKATFLIAVDWDLSSTKSISTLIITIGFAGFGLLVLYLLFLGLLAIVKTIRPEKAEAQIKIQVSVPATSLPLNPEMTRRSFLSLLGWAWVAFTAATLGALSTMLRFAFPNVTFEPPLKFKVGFPNQFAPGVDNRFKDEHRVWIVRDEKSIYALSTICTHLGCTPNWLQAEQKFKCPCHGSGFYITGVNFEGPAPRPLERFEISLAEDGQIQVNEGVKYQQELGQWGLPGSFLDYIG